MIFLTKNFKQIFPLGLLSGFFTIFASLHSYAQTTTNFNDGYITIFRQTSTTTLGSTGTAIYIDEYHPITATQSSANFTVTIPSSGANGMVAGATTSSNGAITRSENGRYVLVPGFSTGTGGASLGAANSTNTLCAVRPIDGTGTINVGITGTANWFTNANDFRGATSDDLTNYWLTGNTLGVLTTTNGTTVTPLIATTTSSSYLNTRVVNIFNGQLYYATGSTTPSAGIYQIGSGKPTLANQTATNINNPIPYGFSISPDGLTMYAINTNSVVRYTYSGTYNSSNGAYTGGVWSAASTGFTLTGAIGLIVDWSNYTFSASTASNGAIVYASNPTNLVRGVDNGTGAITTSSLATLTGFNTFKQIAFSPIKQTVSLSTASPAAASIAPGTTTANLFAFTLSSNEGNATMRKAIIHQNGTLILGTDLTNLKLVYDANNNGLLDATEITNNAYLGTVNGVDVSFTCTNLPYCLQGSAMNFFLIGDVASNASGTIIPTIQSNKSLNGNNYTTNIVNAGASWITMGSVIPTGNTLSVSQTPTIIATANLTPFSACAGTSSATQSMNISGTNMSSAITLTAPSGFEISTSSTSGFASSLTLSNTGTVVSATTVYIRTTAAASGTISGSISATATNAVAQSISISATINALPVISGNLTICNGANSSLSASLAPAASNPWSITNSSIASITTNGLLTALSVGTSSVNFTASNGCQSAVSFIINPIPTSPIINPIAAICSGATLNLNASTISGASYSWTGPNGYSSSLQNPSIINASSSAAGSYSVVSIVAGCSSTPTSVNAIVNSAPAAPVLGTIAPICAGATLNMSASLISGATYSWTGPNGFSSTLQNPSISNAGVAASGTYSVISISNGCSSSAATVTATVNAIPAAPVCSYNSPLCIGNTLNLIANTVVGAIYNWSGPNGFSSTLQNPSISNVSSSAAGNYTTTISVNGCTSSAITTNVVLNTPPSVTITASGPTSFINGGSVTLSSVAISGANYQWYNGLNPIAGATTNAYIATQAGNYTLSVTLNACVAMSNAINVSILGAPTATITANGSTTICAGASILLSAVTAPGNTYQWLLNAQYIPGATSATYLANTSGSYTLLVTNSSNVSATSNAIAITVIPAANTIVTTSGATNFCSGASVTLTATSAPNTTYQWYNGTTSIAGATNATYTATQSGNYFVAIVAANCPVATSTPITVVANPIPVIASSLSPISICSGNSLLYTPTASVSSSVINWSRGSVLGISNTATTGTAIINENLVNITNSPISLTYTLLATANGCSSSANLPVTINPNPTLTSSKSIAAICSGSLFSYLPTSNVANTSIVWTRNAIGGLSNSSASASTAINETLNLSGSSSATATYAFALTTSASCSSTDFITVGVNPVPSIVSTSQFGTACSGIPFTFTPSASISGATITWTRSAKAGISNPSASGTGSISEALVNTTNAPITVNYLLSAIANGCTLSNVQGNFIVNPIPPTPAIVANGLITGGIAICKGETVVFSTNTTNVTTYNWYANNALITQASTLSANTAGIYKLRITNSYACISQFSNEIELSIPCEIGIYMPTVFTPNNDNDNDVVIPSLPGIARLNYYKIINRWGNVVFETNEMQKGWDGNFKGEGQAQDEFFWVIEAVTNLNETIQKQGKIVLIR